jgi:hypothetical protein
MAGLKGGEEGGVGDRARPRTYYSNSAAGATSDDHGQQRTSVSPLLLSRIPPYCLVFQTAVYRIVNYNPTRRTPADPLATYHADPLATFTSTSFNFFI